MHSLTHSPLSAPQAFWTISGRAELLSSLVLAWRKHNWVLRGKWQTVAPLVWLREQLRGQRVGQTATSCLSFTGELRCLTEVLRRASYLLQIKFEKVVGLWLVVLGAETPLTSCSCMLWALKWFLYIHSHPSSTFWIFAAIKRTWTQQTVNNFSHIKVYWKFENLTYIKNVKSAWLETIGCLYLPELHLVKKQKHDSVFIIYI